MKKIKSFRVSTRNISPSLTVRSFIVKGDAGAVFSLRLRKSDGNLYNFKTGAFDTSINTNSSEHVLSNISTSASGYEGSVSLPANASGDTYSFMLYAEPHFDTIISENLLTVNTTGSGNSLVETESYNPYFYSTKIVQDPVSVVTLTKASKANSSKYQSFGSAAADVTISRDPNSKGVTSVDFSWTFKATEADDSNGFLLVRQPIDTDFEISSTTSPGGTEYLVSGSTVADKQLTLDTVDGLSIGDYISNNYSGATIPVIDSIDVSTNTVTLSVVQTLSNSTALTFTGGGTVAIQSYSGAEGVEFTKLTAEVPEFKIKLNGDHSGTGNIDIDNAKGLFLGQTITGPDWDNDTNGVMTITAINRSGNTFAVGATQTVSDNTELTVSGGGNEANIKGRLSISKFPESNTSITLDLDKILTPKGIT
tara:strand:- start:3526 stop:4794 length:1269 start_codon:yes stop_codon:yes gene_type:complete